jgi:hypothetical protein
MSEQRPTVPPFFQVGVLVQRIDEARDELQRALGITFGEIVDRDTGEHQIRVCFSLEGPPYLELIEGPPGSPWDASAGSRIDHIGYWTPEIDAAKRALDREGLELEVDGTAAGGVFTYHRGRSSGLRVELIDGATQPAFYARWGLEPPAA